MQTSEIRSSMFAYCQENGLDDDAAAIITADLERLGADVYRAESLQLVGSAAPSRARLFARFGPDSLLLVHALIHSSRAASAPGVFAHRLLSSIGSDPKRVLRCLGGDACLPNLRFALDTLLAGDYRVEQTPVPGAEDTGLKAAIEQTPHFTRVALRRGTRDGFGRFEGLQLTLLAQALPLSQCIEVATTEAWNNLDRLMPRSRVRAAYSRVPLYMRQTV